MNTPSTQPSAPPAVPGNPFDPGDATAYARWREIKLGNRPPDTAALLVPIQDPYRLSSREHAELLARLQHANLALYQLPPTITDKQAIRALGRQFGLEHLDGNLCADEDRITSLRVEETGRKGGYIPYTNRRLSWHTDGYYNAAEQWIRGIVMHCVRPAASGGDNALLDHELVYILLRDRNPDWIRALMAPDAMTIPANREGDREIRGAEAGPVFSVDAQTGALHMRYSARTRNIVWKDDPDTRAAAAFLQSLWEEGCDYIYHHRLVQGQGIICNNTLHSRSAFHDGASDEGRLLYRARYYDRVTGTGFRDVYRQA